jgi:hypothetical protein
VLGTFSEEVVPAGSSFFIPLKMYAGPCYAELETTTTGTFTNDPLICAAFRQCIQCQGSGVRVASPYVVVNFANTASLQQQFHCSAGAHRCT